MEEKLWTPEEIANHLKVNKVTVLRWLRSGKLTGQRAGRQWRVKDSVLSDFLTVKKEEDSEVSEDREG